MSGRRGALSRLGRGVLPWSAALVFAGAFYELLIDTRSVPELVVLGVVAVLAATGAELAREQSILGEEVRRGWLLRLPLALRAVPGDVVRVSAAALRQLVAPRARVGRFLALPFTCPPGAERDPRQRGRRALAEFAGSVGPNTVIVGVDFERGLLLAHQLVASDPKTIDPLELR
jgi:hypothetical protein